MFGELKVRIIVRRTVRSMFGEQTFAQLRTGFTRVHALSREHTKLIELHSGPRALTGTNKLDKNFTTCPPC